MQMFAQTSLSIPDQDINCGQQITVPITVTDFNNMIGLQFSLQWDPAQLDYTGQTAISEYNNSSFFNTQNTAGGALGFAWFNSGNPITRMDGDSIIFVNFTVIGNNFMTSTINFVSTPTMIEGTQNINNQVVALPSLGVSSGSMTLVDTEKPTVDCPSDKTATTVSGSTTVAVNNLTPQVSDNCGIAAITYSLTGATVKLDSGDASGELFNIGVTIVSYRVSDFTGNDTFCSSEVTVTAGNAGSNNTLTVSAGSAVVQCETIINAPITVEGFEEITDLGFTYNFDATQFTYAGIANFNLAGLGISNFDTTQAATGIISLTWDNNTAQTLIDNSVLFNIQLTSNASATNAAVSTSNVSAQQNNIAFLTQTGTGTLTIQDNVAPMVVCPDNQTITASPGATEVLINNINPIVSDDCGTPSITYTLTGATTGSGTGVASGLNFQIGVTTVTYTATDDVGNSTDCSFDLTVTGEQASDFTLIAQSTTANCDDDDITIDINVAAFDSIAGVQFSVNWDPSILAFVSRDDGIFTSNVLFGENEIANGSIGYAWFDFNGQTVADGTTLFTLHFTSVSGGISPVIFTDNPTLIEITSAASGLPILTPDEIILTAGTITVSDSENPTIGCPEDQNITIAMGETSVVVNDLDPIALDNCGTADVTYTLSGTTTGSGTNSASGETFNIGTTTLTYTATDGAGNTATCSSLVTVDAPGALTVNVISEDAVCSSEPYKVDITVDNFINGTGIQFSVDWEETILQYDSINFNQGLANIFESDFQFNGTGNGELGFAWYDNSFTAQDLPDSTILFTICYSVLSSGGVNSTINITDNPIPREGTIIMNDIPVGVPIAANSGQFSVVDNTPPVVSNPLPESITQYVGLDDCSVIGQFTAPTFTDACSDSITVVSSHAAGASFNIGTTTIIYTATDPSGNSISDSTIITVIDTIAPVLMNCPADITVTADANCEATATWTVPDGTDNCELRIVSGSANANPGAIFTQGTNTVTYTAEDIYGNQSTCSFVVTVEGVAPIVFNNFPGDLIINAADQQCGANIGWLPPTATGGCNTDNGAIVVSSTAAPGDFFPVGVTTVTYTAEDNTGQSISENFTITVIDNQDITVICPTDIEIQADGTVMMDEGNFINTVTSDTCSQYVITFNDIVAFDNCSPISVTQTQGLASGDAFTFGTTMMEFVLSDTMGNNRTCTFQITIAETGDIAATNLDNPTCAGSDLRLSVNTLVGGTYQWSGPGGFLANVQNPVIPNAMTQNSGEYVVKVISENGCTLKDSIMVGVLSGPTISASGSDLSCSGDDTLRLFATPSNIPIQSYAWTGPGGFTTDFQNPIIPNPPSSAVGIYIVTGTSSNGCTDMDTVVVGLSGIVMPTLMSDVGTGMGINLPDTVCANTAVTLTGTAYDGIVNYSWIAGTGAGLPADLDSNVITVTPTVAGTYIYSFSADLDGSCTSDTARLTLVVQDGAGDVVLGSNSPLACVASTQTIDLTATGGMDITTYAWTGPNNFTASDQNPSIPASSLASGTYTLVATANGGCTTTRTIDVVVSVQGEAPEVTLSSASTNVCEGEALTFTAATTPNATYAWVGPNGFTSFDSTVTINNIMLENAGAYQLRTTIDGCTSAPRTVGPINILSNPVINADNIMAIRNQAIPFNVAENDVLIAGVPFTINLLSAAANGILTDNGNGMFSYTPTTDFVGMDQIAYELCYQDCPALCGMATITIRTEYDPSTCVVPSLITPNGDGFNDELIISCVASPPKVGSELVVFNEWGSEVFRESPYQNGWNGTYKGEDLPDGTYYYIFKEDNDDNDPKKGYVTIFR